MHIPFWSHSKGHQWLCVPPDAGRNEIDPGYKAHRKACPTEVSAAANRLKWLLPKLGVPVVRESGWEADDIIGTLAVRAVEVSGHQIGWREGECAWGVEG